ncbi:hypothetical protein MD484_g4911, partial [Candolleomyces efflorescens]
MLFSKKLKTGTPPADTLSSPPRVPVELLRKIVGYTVRLDGHESVELEDPFSPHGVGEELPEIDPGIFSDRISFGQVNSTLRALVHEISSEYLVIRSAKELKHFIHLFEHSQAVDGLVTPLGERTRRIDLKIVGRYDPKRVAALLKLTPNLLVFVHQSNRHRGDLGRVNKELIRGLMWFGKSIRRLDFDSIGEAPALWDLIDVSRFLPNLETLRILCLHSYPKGTAALHLKLAHFRSLKTLSLGRIPEPQTKEIPNHYVGVWDPLLRYLGRKPEQLPVLERFETGVAPVDDTTFFETHGYKIRMLRISTGRAGIHLPIILGHCVNLESLVFEHGSWAMNPACIPTGHHSLKRICITPSIERVTVVPPSLFLFAVQKPLEELVEAVDGMDLPAVEEVRVRDYGMYGRIVEHVYFLNMWWRRFALKGVRFVDQAGKPYDNIVDRA